MSTNKQVSLILLAIALSIGTVSAKPYYWMWNEAAAQAQQQPQVGEIAAQQPPIEGQQMTPENQLPQRIQGHLGQLYEHGSTAVKSLAETVQPDIKNIGQDLQDVYHVTRDNVNKRIEPITQTVKPYIDHAQKAMAPFVNQAREEVPKLLQHAGQNMQKVGEQVREGISGVWGRLANTNNQQQQQTGGEQISEQMQQAGAQFQQGANNMVQKSGEAIQQVAGQATQA